MTFAMRALVPLAAFSLAMSLPSLAEAQIKRPGAHPKYSVELEPHLVLGWGHGGPGDDDAIGLGMRATIPFLDNGPISKINNNMGIGFGLDWLHNGDACKRWWWGRGRQYWDDCSIDIFELPVVVQWNFWLTPIISVFGEAGLTVERWHWEVDNCPDCDDTDTDIEPVFWGGGRFLFGAGSPVGGVVRLGWPYVSLGVGILL
jgi:hypothetical protein